jgi:hypothetical protein
LGGACQGEGENAPGEQSRTFGEDVTFLQRHVELVLLRAPDRKAMVAVVPAFQGRVMTSTGGGFSGPSFGWINYDLIASGELQPHINVFGGEDRFWLGPEGGQFGLFFRRGDPFDLQHWQTPPVIDTEAFEVLAREEDAVSFSHRAVLSNYSGTTFELRIDRRVRLLQTPEIVELLGLDLSETIHTVAFETTNSITNVGSEQWTKQAGLLSVWILGMFKPSPSTTVVIPYVSGSEEELGPVVNDDYFGQIPPERLRIGDQAVFFAADGKERGKIGLSPWRAKSWLGSWDPALGFLTAVQYNQPEGAGEYVNSAWRIQEDPYSGDVVNSYNDGPPEPGARPLGPFYELETSSPAKALRPQESLIHIHRTFHFQAPREELERIAAATLNVDLTDIPRGPVSE